MIVYLDLDGEHRISEAEAIRRSKGGAYHKNKYVYPNDEEALIDFIVIYWAWRE